MAYGPRTRYNRPLSVQRNRRYRLLLLGDWPDSLSAFPSTATATTYDATDASWLWDNHTTNTLTSFDFSDDGNYIAVGNGSDNFARSYSLDNPFDLSAGTFMNGKGSTSPSNIRYAQPGRPTLNDANDGLYWAYFQTSGTDALQGWGTDNRWGTKSAGATDIGAILKSTYFDGAEDGAFDWCRDTGRVIWSGDNGGTDRIKMIAPAGAYDWSSSAEETETTTFPTGVSYPGDDIRVNKDGTKVLLLANETLFLGKMSTAYDLTTLVWDNNVTYDASGLTGAITCFFINTAGTELWFGDSTATSPDFYRIRR